jgi:hypothetical protein
MNLKTNLLFILLLLMSVAAQCIFGNFPFAFFAFPLDAILALLWIALIGYGYKEKRHSEAVRLWLSPQCTCWTLGWFLAGCLVIGLFPQLSAQEAAEKSGLFSRLGSVCISQIIIADSRLSHSSVHRHQTHDRK